MQLRRSNKILLLVMMCCISTLINAQQTTINANEIVAVKQPLREKIFVHTDKDFYIAGEILWFKLYDVSADSLKPLDLSNVAYVEILNANQKPVLQATVALNDGSGNGSFYLTSSLTSGNYIFRAYTNWMKNFDADLFFQKNITIVNTLTPLAQHATDNAENYEAGFYPEGGNLVAGLQSKVGFKVTDKYGKGIDCSGNIVDENKRTVASFSTLKFGMGSFYFTPEANNTYSAVLNINNRSVTKELPAVNSKGYVMNAKDDNDAIKVSVQSNASTRSPVYLIAYNNRNVSEALIQTTDDNGNAYFVVQRSGLHAGITHLIVFNDNKQPVCERLVFKRPEQMQLNVSPDNTSYTTRSEVKLNVATSAGADLSMAVYLLDSLQGIDENNILNYLWLTSDVKGYIESPAYYFNNDNPEVDSALENLLLTQGWSRFKTANNEQAFHFAPEREGHIIEGRVTDKNSGVPGKNVNVYLSVPGKYCRFAPAISNDSGEVFFDVKDFYGLGEIVVQTEKNDSNYRVDIADPFSEKKASWNIAPLSLAPEKLQQLTQHNLAMQVQNAYAINALNKFNSPYIDSVPFYGAPDAVYYLDNYVRFNTMEEILREYVVNVNVRLHDGVYGLRSFDPRNHSIFETNPLVLIDGVPEFDMNKVMGYNPLKIKRADVVNKKCYINSFTANGIVSYSTYNGDLDGFQFDPGTIELSYDGLQLQREFYSPQYNADDARQSRMPDYRNVLYWSPQVNQNKSLSFFTSDIKGKYVVIVQGLNADGKAGYTTTSFEVK
jgi:hypothetical protein